MELSPHRLPAGEGSVIPGGCKSPLLEGEDAKKETCHDLNIYSNSQTVSEARPYICGSGTSTATINAPPHRRGTHLRVLTCPSLKEAASQVRNPTYEMLHLD